MKIDFFTIAAILCIVVVICFAFVVAAHDIHLSKKCQEICMDAGYKKADSCKRNGRVLGALEYVDCNSAILNENRIYVGGGLE